MLSGMRGRALACCCSCFMQNVHLERNKKSPSMRIVLCFLTHFKSISTVVTRIIYKTWCCWPSLRFSLSLTHSLPSSGMAFVNALQTLSWLVYQNLCFISVILSKANIAKHQRIADLTNKSTYTNSMRCNIWTIAYELCDFHIFSTV